MRSTPAATLYPTASLPSGKHIIIKYSGYSKVEHCLVGVFIATLSSCQCMKTRQTLEKQCRLLSDLCRQLLQALGKRSPTTEQTGCLSSYRPHRFDRTGENDQRLGKRSIKSHRPQDQREGWYRTGQHLECCLQKSVFKR